MAGGSGSPGESLLLKEEQINKAFARAWKVHKSRDELYDCKSSPSEVIISFPGSGSVKDWFSGTPFGETEIHLGLFPSLKSIGNDETALVNKAFLQRFEAVEGKKSFVNEVDEAMTKQKQIVFTGHSSGAAVAILATLWALDRYLTPNTNRIPPVCVTFGSPLVGNHIFSHATRRENWSGYFMHFVMKYDMVPRLLLSPLSSLEQRFDPILEFFNPKSRSFMKESIGNHPIISDFFLAVMTNVATATSHAACKFMGSTKSVPEMLANFIALSPYRPFGTYFFFTGTGKLIVVRNPDAALQLLFFSAQLSTEADTPQVAKCLQEHLNYGEELKKESLAIQNLVYLDQLEKLALSADGSDGDIAATEKALNDLGLSSRARLCLGAAGELEKQKSRNENKIDMRKASTHMKELEEYKAMNKIQRVGYYDAFKLQNYRSDFRSNVNRLELAGVWDEIIEMLKRYELPDEFEGKEEWVEIGTKFRRLVEPLDIANFYRHVRKDQSGPYMGEKGRPKRYRYTQRWLEHAQRKPKGAASESCFWAEAEELYIKTVKKTPFEHFEKELQELEQEIKKWIDEGELTKEDVFLEDSTFVKWWKNLPPQHKEGSCIRSFINV